MLFNIGKKIIVDLICIQPESTEVKDSVILVYRSGTDPMLAASGQYWSGSVTAAFIRIIARKDKSHG